MQSPRGCRWTPTLILRRCAAAPHCRPRGCRYAWDRNLTDEGGPYIELMAGVYTDNQPDFSFLAPLETKTFSQHW
jgi:hypothetical protein